MKTTIHNNTKRPAQLLAAGLDRIIRRTAISTAMGVWIGIVLGHLFVMLVL